MFHHKEKAPRLKEACPERDFPPALEAAVATMLAKAPEMRQASMHDVAACLERIKSAEKSGAQRIMEAGQQVARVSGLSRGEQDTQETTLSRLSVPAWPIMLAAVLLIVGLGMVAFFQGYFTPPPGKTANTGSTADGAAPQLRPTAMAANTLNPKHYGETPAIRTEISISGQPWVILKWPEDYDIGGFKTAPTAANPERKAGGFKWKKNEPIIFQPSVDFLDNPKNFEIFKPGDLYGVDFHDCPPKDMRPALLNQISEMKDLRSLDLEGCPDFVDADLKIIEKMPNLKYLSLCSTNVSGDVLAKSPLLQQIDWLRFSRCSNASAVVTALRGSTRIRGLRLDHDNLTAEDYKTIATMSNLEGLSLQGSLFKQSNFVALAPLKKLSYLFAPDLPITTAIIGTLKTMRNNSVKKLTVASEGLSQADQLKIRSVFPTIDLYIPSWKQVKENVPIETWRKLMDQRE